jgi:hypothetical protein
MPIVYVRRSIMELTAAIWPLRAGKSCTWRDRTPDSMAAKIRMVRHCKLSSTRRPIFHHLLELPGFASASEPKWVPRCVEWRARPLCLGCWEVCTRICALWSEMFGSMKKSVSVVICGALEMQTMVSMIYHEFHTLPLRKLITSPLCCARNHHRGLKKGPLRQSIIA